ncbi:MAG TPA: gephyrin-like molybdotransferase Glp [Planctomycetota bacterium]|nr:gephyrin-like molybdotransferase Glp [Planctomycetota bacterium]
MRTPSEVLSEILGRITPLAQLESAPLSQAPGRVLGRNLVSDLDLPPFNKSAVDGFAVFAADFEPESAPLGERTLPVVGEARAGAPWPAELARGACVEIYTGAEVPRGSDAIIMVEQSTRGAAGVVLRDRPARGAHICPRGQDLTFGATVLRAGRRLRASDLSLLASVGCDPVPVIARPRVVVLTTGDELVPPSARPGPGQIRESNTQHLAALCEKAGAIVEDQGVVADAPEALAECLGRALASCDALITTGGVSMGRYDLVGTALAALGVEPVLHKVAIKPGKPLWFGMAGKVPVFALPGNPVSCLVNHEVFVRPALLRLGGEQDPEPKLRRGRWLGAPLAPNPREQYLPVKLEPGDDGVESLEPVRWNGSADVAGIARAEAFAVVPIDTAVARGDLLRFRPLA